MNPEEIIKYLKTCFNYNEKKVYHNYTENVREDGGVELIIEVGTNKQTSIIFKDKFRPSYPLYNSAEISRRKQMLYQRVFETILENLWDRVDSSTFYTKKDSVIVRIHN